MPPGSRLLRRLHYELATQKSPAELAGWIAAGADFNELRAPGLLAALQALKRGEAVTNPVTGASILPGDHVVLEMPLGREFAETAHLIDIVIWVDTPLDVALARNIRSLAADAAEDRQGDPREFPRWLEAYLYQYEEQIRAILQLQRRRVAGKADIVLDGMWIQQDLIVAALKAVREFRGGQLA